MSIDAVSFWYICFKILLFIDKNAKNNIDIKMNLLYNKMVKLWGFMPL